MTERKTGAQIASMTGLDLANWLADLDIDGLRRDLGRVATKAADDFTELDRDLRANVEDLQADRDGLIDDIREAADRDAALAARVDGLRRDISNLQAADGATSATFENLGREVEDLHANLGGLRGDVADLRDTVAKLGDTVAKLKDSPDVGDLDEAGRARVAALNAARAALASRSLMGPSSAVDALDVVQVARFILTGQDPWADEAGEKAEEPDSGPDLDIRRRTDTPDDLPF